MTDHAVRPVVACVAWYPQDYAPRLLDLWNRSIAASLAAGEPLPRPYPDSSSDICEDCGIAVAVGPKQAATLTTWIREDKPFEVMCLLCATLAIAASGGDASGLLSLGNTDND